MTLPFVGKWDWAVAPVAALLILVVVVLMLFPGEKKPTIEDRVKALEMEVGVQRDQIVILHEELNQLRSEVYGNSMDLDVLWYYTPTGEYVERCLSTNGCPQEVLP